MVKRNSHASGLGRDLSRPRSKVRNSVKIAGTERSLKHESYSNNSGLGKGEACSNSKNEAIDGGIISYGHAHALFASLCVFYVYFATVHHSLPGGDSGELITAAYETGVAHPPGYPLFTLLAKVFITIIPDVVTVAAKVNLLSVTCGVTAVFFIDLSIYRLTCSQTAAHLGSFMFACSNLVWTWSVVAEVFSLNNLLLSILIYIAVCFEKRKQENTLQLCLLGSFVSGLCLSNQHTSVLYLVIIIPWVFWSLWAEKELTPSLFLLTSLTFLCGLLPYLYLPLSSWLHIARWTWGEHTSLSGLLTHILRIEYGTLDLLKDHKGQGFMHGLKAYLNHLNTDFTFVLLILFVMSVRSVVQGWRRNQGQGSVTQEPSVLSVFWAMLIAYLVFFCWRANLDINKPLFFRVVERFWMQSDMVVCILAAVAYKDLVKLLPSSVSKWCLHVVVVYILVGFQVGRNYMPRYVEKREAVIEEFSLQNLEAFPRDSIILTKGDLPSNSFRYYHLCEGVRPDIHLFDQEVLTYQWSVPAMSKFYPGIIFPGDLLLPVSQKMPDGRQSFTFKQFIDANYDRHPIFACIGVQEAEPSWQSDYTLWHFGVCHKFIKKGTAFDADTWIHNTSSITQKWTHLYSSIDDGTWDHVANSEMWRARTATALLLLDKAIELPSESKIGATYLEKSYKIYLEEITKHENVPSYWHRNFAIVCELLARAPTQMDIADLLRKTVHHFEVYLSLEPDDPDASKIQHAIVDLRAHLKKAP